MKKAENTGNYIDISFSNKRKQCIFVTTLQKLLNFPQRELQNRTV